MAQCIVSSPIGNLLLEADAIGLTRLTVTEAQVAACDGEAAAMMVLRQAKAWLQAYFAGGNPSNLPPLHLQGTPFQTQVWQLLLKIPYGTTRSYGDLAQAISKVRDGKPMSAQAVGGAVKRNPVAIMVPCHRVIGSDGALTGYALGVERKRTLLQLEGAWPNDACK